MTELDFERERFQVFLTILSSIIKLIEYKIYLRLKIHDITKKEQLQIEFYLLRITIFTFGSNQLENCGQFSSYYGFTSVKMC